MSIEDQGEQAALAAPLVRRIIAQEHAAGREVMLGYIEEGSEEAILAAPQVRRAILAAHRAGWDVDFLV